MSTTPLIVKALTHIRFLEAWLEIFFVYGNFLKDICAGEIVCFALFVRFVKCSVICEMKYVFFFCLFEKIEIVNKM